MSANKCYFIHQYFPNHMGSSLIVWFIWQIPSYQCDPIRHQVVLCRTCSWLFLGLPVKPLIYVERKKLSIEEQYKYISEEEDEEEEDVEWTPHQEKKKKENKQDEMLNECKFSVAIPKYYQRNLL